MKRVKKGLLSVLAVAFTATTMVAATSCSLLQGGKHEHAYTDVVTAPTCTAEGFTTYTCECGDSYVDTQVPATGHSYSTKVTKYPTATEAGERTVACDNCDEAPTTESIDALMVSMPKVADVLVGVIGSVNAKIALDEGSTIIATEEYDVETEDGAVGAKYTVTVALAEAVLNTQDGNLAGHVKVEINASEVEYDAEDATVSTANSIGEFYVYVNGDAVAWELVNFDGSEQNDSVDLSELAYGMLAQQMDMDYDQFVTLAYVGKEVANYLPAVVNLIQAEMPTLSEDYIKDVQALFQLVGQDIILETEDNGNSVYTVNLAALGHFVDEVKDETVASYINKAFGAGSMEAISKFVVGLPEMKVRDVANSVIALGNTYGIDVYNVYYLVNLAAYQLGAENFDIQEEIEKQYDKTLGALLIESNSEVVMTVEEMKEQLSAMMTMASNLTVDSLYAMITGNTEDVFTEQLSALIAGLPEMASASLTFDENGAFVSGNAFVGPHSVDISVIDGAYQLDCVIMDVEASLSVSANGISLVASHGEEILANIALLQNENGYEADVTVYGDDYLDLTVTVEDGVVTAGDIAIRAWDVYYEGQYDEDGNYIGEEEIRNFLTVTEINYAATVDANGQVETANVTIKGWSDEEVDGEWVEVFKEVAGISYVNNDGNVSIVALVEDEGKITLTEEATENGVTWTLKVIDLKNEEGVMEELATATFSYTENGTQLVYNADMIVGELGDVLDFSLTVDNGEIVSFHYAIRELGGSESGYGYTYDEGENSYYESVDYEYEKALEVSYEDGAFNFTFTDIETEITTLELWDVENGEWVLVSETSSTYDNSISASITKTEEGVLINVNGAELAISILENGIEFEANVEGIVEAGITVTVDENGVLHIGYDIAKIMVDYNNWITGQGGVSISIS